MRYCMNTVNITWWVEHYIPGITLTLYMFDIWNSVMHFGSIYSTGIYIIMLTFS